MCNACGFLCCASDVFQQCGCDTCGYDDCLDDELDDELDDIWERWQVTTMKSEIKEGDWVVVPSKRGHISSLCITGKVVVIAGQYCKVLIQTGRAKGYWTGKLSEVRKSYAAEKES